MTVLVTGGAGYIGSHMVLDLLAAGKHVVVLDNLSTGFRWSVPPEAEFVLGDVGDKDLVGRIVRLSRVTSVIHFAGAVIVSDSVSDPLGYYYENTVKSHALLAAVVAAGVEMFIFSSSASVYGIPAVNPVVESAPLAPISPYGASKLMTERMLADTALAHPLRYVALRYFNVAGADPRGRAGEATARATHLVKIAAQAALGKRPFLEIYGTDYPTPDGTCIRDYIHVTDLVRAHSAALGYLKAGGTSCALNCGYAQGFSVREVIAAMKRVSGVDFPVKTAGRRPGDPAMLIAASNAIEAALEWTPEFDTLDTIAAHALAWERHLMARSDAECTW